MTRRNMSMLCRMVHCSVASPSCKVGLVQTSHYLGLSPSVFCWVDPNRLKNPRWNIHDGRISGRIMNRPKSERKVCECKIVCDKADGLRVMTYPSTH
jgi:hypothetical protein